MAFHVFLPIAAMKSSGIALGYAVLLLLCGVCGWSCHSHSHAAHDLQPEEVASLFMYALQHAHYDSAKQYATTDSYEMIDLVASIAESTPQGRKKNSAIGYRRATGFCSGQPGLCNLLK